MKKITLIIVLTYSVSCSAQKINGKLNFQKGKTLEISTEIVSSSAMDVMGQSITSSVNSAVIQKYLVKEVDKNTATLDHTIKSIKFKAEGMGQSQSFDSDNEEDKKNEIGKSLDRSLKSKYSIVINNKGVVASVHADTAQSKSDNNPILGMMLAQLNINTEAPKAGDATMFKVLPDKEVSKGSSWTDSSSSPTGTKAMIYTLKDISDKELLIDFTETATLNTTQQVMGFDATIHTKSKGSGQITLDKTSGLIKQKKESVKSEQTMEAQGQKIPSTANLTITTVVREK